MHLASVTNAQSVNSFNHHLIPSECLGYTKIFINNCAIMPLHVWMLHCMQYYERSALYLPNTAQLCCFITILRHVGAASLHEHLRDHSEGLPSNNRIGLRLSRLLLLL